MRMVWKGIIWQLLFKAVEMEGLDCFYKVEIVEFIGFIITFWIFKNGFIAWNIM